MIAIVVPVVYLAIGLFTDDFDNNNKIPPLTNLDPDRNSKSGAETKYNDLNSIPIVEHEPIKTQDKENITVSHLYMGIEARVFDGVTKKPVQSFTIYYCNLEDEKPHPNPKEWISLNKRGNKTMACRWPDGSFRILGLEEGAYCIAVDAQGYPAVLRRDIKVPQKKSPLIIELPRGNYIEGMVVNCENILVSGITVCINVEELDNVGDLPPARRSATTNHKGEFLFGELPPGRYSLIVKRLQFKMAEIKDIFISHGGCSTHRISLPPLAKVEFFVTDELGNGLPNSTVTFMSSTDNEFLISFPSVKTNMYGKSTIDYVPVGVYDLRIYKNTYQHYEEKNVRIYAGEDKILIKRHLIHLPR